MRLSPGAVIAPLLLVSILILPARAVRADVYRWTDSRGVIHFTDSPENIPREFRSAPSGTAETGSPGPVANPPESGPPGTKPDEQTAPSEESSGGASSQEEPQGEKTSPYDEAVKSSDAVLDHFGRDETWWRDRKKFWEQRLSDARRLHDETRRQFTRVNQRYDSREYKEMKLLRERMEGLEKDIAKAQEMLGGDLAREARKAGAPPGWVR